MICSQCSSLNENFENTLKKLKEGGMNNVKSNSNLSTKSSQTLFSNIIDINQNIIDVDQNKISDNSATSKRLLKYCSKNQGTKNKNEASSDKFIFNKSVQFGKF